MEVHKTQVSFFGRVADDFTRKVIMPPDVDVSLEPEGRAPLYKRDGYFAFTDLAPSPPDYRIRIGARSFLSRTVTQALPAGRSLELNGNDELYVSVTGITSPQGPSPQVTFDKMTVVPPIDDGAAVLGPGSFRTTLKAPLEGKEVGVASLDSVQGLAVNQLLRIVRSTSLLVRPGPYYPFPDGATVIALHVAANDGAATPIAGAAVEIGKINGNAATSVAVQELKLNVFGLGGTSTLLLDDNGKSTTTNERGDAVFYFPGANAIIAIEVTVSKPQFQPATQAVTVTAGRRNIQTITLSKL
jgi:hypothetical protein